jgi:response regulator RpfG family c-di-GMP phosphodiesterase
MPGMSGFELLGEIQRRRECKDMLAIALSGLDDLNYVRRAYLSGAAAFIEKHACPPISKRSFTAFGLTGSTRNKDRLELTALTPAGA